MLKKIEEHLTKYLTIPTDYVLPVCLWAAYTHIWPNFSVAPYLAITSATKQSGKTLLAEMLAEICSNAEMAKSSAAVLMRKISQEHVIPFLDEAEALSAEGAELINELMNVGYRKGQKIERMVSRTKWDGFDVFIPKCFVLIGDVYDALRDRCIVVIMVRREPKAFYDREMVEPAARELREELHQFMTDKAEEIKQAYWNLPQLTFLTGREAEIWRPLFAVCSVIAPERIPELQRCAVDMMAEKTQDARSFMARKEAESNAMEDIYRVRLLRDLAVVIDGKQHIPSASVVATLREIPTSPWRKFRGSGLDDRMLASMLDIFGLNPKNIRVGKKVVRGYKRVDVLKALEKIEKEKQ